MKISTKGQYALEALIDLQVHAADGQECLKNIAERRGISEPYLNQIFTSLRKAGVVESVRGAQGGFKLTRKPDEITAGEILRSAEGTLTPVKCANGRPDGQSDCPMFDYCATRMLWARISADINVAMNSYTLADLVVAYTNNLAPTPPEQSN